jgi:hypothetical protein
MNEAFAAMSRSRSSSEGYVDGNAELHGVGMDDGAGEETTAAGRVGTSGPLEALGRRGIVVGLDARL